MAAPNPSTEQEVVMVMDDYDAATLALGNAQSVLSLTLQALEGSENGDEQAALFVVKDLLRDARERFAKSEVRDAQ